jgi:hypothetical protein
MQYKRFAIQLQYPDLVHGIDYKIINEGDPTEIFEWITDQYPQPSNEEMLQWYNGNIYRRDRTGKSDGYKSNGCQHDDLYHDIDDGLFGENAKTGRYYLNNKAVKEKYSKPVE